MIGHNEISSMCRVALYALGNENLRSFDSAIYQVAHVLSGVQADRSSVEKFIAQWAKEQAK